MDKNKYEQQVITPPSRKCPAIGVSQTKGNVQDAKNLTGEKKGVVRLINDGGDTARIILDLGAASPGGYPVFKVTAYKGEPVVRLSYADRYEYIEDESFSIFGDFQRGSCKYLGVELPVLPGNPNRFEQYSVKRTGLFTYPLIQGQQRFVMITLETENSMVELEEFYIYYTSDLSSYDGHFLSNHAALNRLWYASTYTVQLASLDNSQSWEILEKKLLLRALSKGNPAGIYKNGKDWKDYSFRFSVQISRNPHCISGTGWMVRAADQDNGLLLRLDLDGTLHIMSRTGGVNKYLTAPLELAFPVADNFPYEINTVVSGDLTVLYINGEKIYEFRQDLFPNGTVGFCQSVEKWAIVDYLDVSLGENTLWHDDFSGNLDAYEFTRSLPFLADGAKRDRLPWIGDLDWADRNAFYAFKNYKYIPNSLKMFSLHQTPEGYIWGTCYPENTKRPDFGEYGYYESDIFSAWFVPTLADYLLFTDDVQTTGELYQNVVNDLEYLEQYVESDGLFNQRYATSKGLWDHVLNDIGKYTYNNCIIQDAFQEGAFIASYLGKKQDARRFSKRAAQMKNAILKNFWNEEKGWFNAGENRETFCDMANSLALALGYVNPDNARRIVDNMLRHLGSSLTYGKILSLFIRGCYRYHFDSVAYEMLTGTHGVDPQSGYQVNWIDSIMDEKTSATTSECQYYKNGPEIADGRRWLDRSHPDTAIAHLLSGFILGIQPSSPGFATFTAEPHMFGLSHCEGIIPTPRGDIFCSCSVYEDRMILDISHPEGTKPTVILDEKYKDAKITVNGKQVSKCCLIHVSETNSADIRSCL